MGEVQELIAEAVRRLDSAGGCVIMGEYLLDGSAKLNEAFLFSVP